MSKKNLQTIEPFIIQNPTPAPIKEVYERQDFYYIVFGGSLLAACAGFVNVICIIVTSTTVSHSTGTSSKFSIGLAQFDMNQTLRNFLLFFTFCFGSIVVGFFSQKEKFHYSRKYGLFLIGEALIICFVLYYLKKGEFFIGSVASCFAMGIQNALFTNFSGAVVRTTHVTGLLTDLGLIIGHVIRGKEKNSDLWRLKVLIPLYVGFLFGGVIAKWCLDIMGIDCMYIPIIILGGGGIIWTFWRLKYKKRLFIKDFKDNSLF